MKVIILCGGYGTRISEETKIKPKPMVKIGKFTLVEHIMHIYNYYGYNEFILALGYKGYYIRKYFKKKKSLKIKLINTGIKTLTGGRLLRLKKFIKPGENFMLTYGDGISNQNLKQLLNFHLKHKKIATMTIVRPPVRFGIVEVRKNLIIKFTEKPHSKSEWINGGFFVLNYKIFDFIKNDQTMLEREPIASLRKKKNYTHLNTMDFGSV